MKYILTLLLSLATLSLSGEGIRVGVGRKCITPPLPFWLTGYAFRDKPSTEVLHDLWTKAIVFEDTPENRVAVVTCDLLGLSREIYEEVVQKADIKYGIPREKILLNSSHTHSGPVVWPCLSTIFNFTSSDLQAVARYNQELVNNIVVAIGLAIDDLEPCEISSGHGFADFAINRRQQTDSGVVIGLNARGLVDHDVPVILVKSKKGNLKAVLFSYACHNTTLSLYSINGDYCGFAQIGIEKANPGSTALFIEGCGADQNPNPRGTIENAEEHGRSLADAVNGVITAGNLKSVNPPIRTGFTATTLDFMPFKPEVYREELLGSDIYKQRRAELMLEAYNKGYDVTKYPYHVQVIRFSKDLTILGMSGEVVVDYPVRLKEMYGKENLLVAGYCNEVQCYIPSERIIKEGGYEPESSMIYYAYPGPFKTNVEEKVLTAVRKSMKQTGARPSVRK